jgi:hypothetical protein
VLSREAVSTKVPPGEKTAGEINLCPESQLQIFAVPSEEPVNTKAPSGEKTAAEITLVWPCTVFTHSREPQLQLFAV